MDDTVLETDTIETAQDEDAKKKKSICFQENIDLVFENLFCFVLNHLLLIFLQILFPKIPVPTIFTWDVESPLVHVTGDWDEWQRFFNLSLEELEFFGLLPLYPGFFTYIFAVDGKWKYAPTIKIELDSQGNIKYRTGIIRLWNFIYPNDSLLEDPTDQTKVVLNFQVCIFKKSRKKTSNVPSHYVTFINRHAYYLPVDFYSKVRNFSETQFAFLEFLDHIKESDITFRGILYSVAETSLSFHGYLNHIFFFAIKESDWKIKQKLLSSWTRNNEKGDTKIFCADLLQYYQLFNEIEKLINSNRFPRFFFIEKPLTFNLFFLRKVKKKKIYWWSFSSFFRRCFFN